MSKALDLVIDIETRSECDLRAAGAYVYAEDPSTEILCVAWCVADAPMNTWRMDMSPVMSSAMLDRLQLDIGAAGRVIAHNVEFEKQVLTGPAGKKLGLVVPTDVRFWDDTAARAAAMGLPRSLEGAAQALGLSVQKDKEGHSLMLRMCKPKPKTGRAFNVAPVYFEDSERMEKLTSYCATDVEVERLLNQRLLPLMPEEREAWENTIRANERGIAVDEALVTRLSFLIEDATRLVNMRIREATQGAVPAVTNHAALTRWLEAQGVPAIQGIDGVGKAAVNAMLEALGNEDEGVLTPEEKAKRDLIREVLIIRQDGGKSSAAKYRALLSRMNKDGRVRGSLTYCGASATGRWSSRGVQLQNLPRGGMLKDVDGAIEDVLGDTPIAALEFIHDTPSLVIASELLRPSFIAKG